MKLLTTNNLRTRKFAPCGSKVADEYSYIVKNCKTLFEVTGKVNIYERIQSFSDSHDLKTMITKLVNGDNTVLSVNVPRFFDATGMPRNLTDYQNALLQSKSIFNGLPLEIRQKYNHNIDDFTIALFDGSFEQYVNAEKAKFNTEEVLNETIKENN